MNVRRLALSVVATLLAGCGVNLKSDQPAAQVYVLTAAVPAATASAAAATAALDVGRPQAAPGLDGDAIVVLRTGGRLDHYAGVRWAGPVPSLLQGLLIDALRAGRRFALVQAAPGPYGADYLLTLELRHFEAEYTDGGPPTVHVAIAASLGRRGERASVINLVAESRIRAAADRMQAVISAFDQATAEALSQLVAAAVPPAATP